MQILNTIEDATLEQISGGSIFGYAVGWVSRACYEYSKTQTEGTQYSFEYPIVLI